MLQQVSAPLCGVDRPGLEGLFLISAVLAHHVACSLHDPIPGQAAGPRVPSQLGPVRASVPVDYKYRTEHLPQSFLIEAAKLVRHPFRWRLMVDLLTVISAALQMKLKAASARIKVAFRLDTLARSKAAAKRGVMAVL